MAYSVRNGTAQRTQRAERNYHFQYYSLLGYVVWFVGAIHVPPATCTRHAKYVQCVVCTHINTYYYYINEDNKRIQQ